MLPEASLPNLLTLTQLLTPVIATHERLDEIVRASAVPENDGTGKVIRQGLFVLAVGSLEVMMQRLQMCIYQHFPIKMQNRQLKVESLVGDVLVWEALREQAQYAVRDVMYGTLDDVLTSFKRATGVDVEQCGEDALERFREMKETRNLLLHNNLRINDVYKAKAGTLARTPDRHGQLEVDPKYLESCLKTIKGIVIEIEIQLQSKYCQYTRISAFRRLWEYIVFRPTVTPFDEFWEAIDSEDRIVPRESPPPRYSRMSSTERQFFEIWKDIFCEPGIGRHDDDFEFTFRSFDLSSRIKIAFLLNAARQMR